MLKKIFEVGLQNFGWIEGENVFTVLDVNVFTSKLGNEILIIKTDVQDILINIVEPNKYQASLFIGLIKAVNPSLSRDELLNLGTDQIKNMLINKKFKVNGFRGNNGGIYLDAKSIRCIE